MQTHSFEKGKTKQVVRFLLIEFIHVRVFINSWSIFKMQPSIQAYINISSNKKASYRNGAKPCVLFNWFIY